MTLYRSTTVPPTIVSVCHQEWCLALIPLCQPKNKNAIKYAITQIVMFVRKYYNYLLLSISLLSPKNHLDQR